MRGVSAAKLDESHVVRPLFVSCRHDARRERMHANQYRPVGRARWCGGEPTCAAAATWRPAPGRCAGARAGWTGTRRISGAATLPPVLPLLGEGPSQVEPTYTLGAGDKLRIIVYGQDGLTNSYLIDTAGRIDMPLIGSVGASGLTARRLAGVIASRLRNGYIREPHVSVEVEAYRPFFILGQVTYPGQYPFVPRMTVETAVAIAGGYTPRAYRWSAEVTRPMPDGPVKLEGPPMFLLKPGDTVFISERWF